MSTNFWQRLDDVAQRWDVLQHSFYQRWSDGELSAEELATYSGQYRHAVVGLAEGSAKVAAYEPRLIGHATEELAHIDLFDGFVRAAGGDAAAEPTPESATCAREWASDRGLLGGLVALYAIESAQPAISDTKRAGLVELYGWQHGAGTAYFDVHAVRDHEHAAEGRELIEPLLDGADHDALLAGAEAVLRANWELLDGVERITAQV